MNIWIGALLPKAFAKKVKVECLEINKEVGLDEFILSFPQHVSLKIRFKHDDYPSIEKCLVEYFNSVKPFIIETDKIGQNERVLWVLIKDNPFLKAIHKELDILLEARFNIKQHIYDKSFIYHSSLFVDDDTNKIKKMYPLVKDKYQDIRLKINKVAIGVSIDDNIDNFKIAKIINLNG